MVRSTKFYDVELSPSADTSGTSELLEVFEILKPKVSSTPLIRIGGEIDGAYLVPDDLTGITACFSPGVNRIKYFEDYLTDHYGIRSHMCDFTCDVDDFVTPLREGQQTFAKKWLDVNGSDDAITLDGWVHEHEPEGDLLLQMDIEGAEYRNILGTSDDTLARFRMIVLELHGLGEMLKAPVLRDAVGPFFQKLAKSFTSVHAHPNNCCGDFAIPGTDVRIPNFLELTLVRHDRFVPGPGVPLLPHPLDLGRNVPRKEPLFLSDAWCDHQRPLESRVRILEETQHYRDSIGELTPDGELSSILALTMQSVETVAALAAPVRAREDLIEVAHGKTYQLSSAYGTLSRRGVVEPRKGYFFHTDFGRDQSITVDLGKRYRIGRVEVTNRDSNQERARYIFAALSTRKPARKSVFPMFKNGRLAGGAWQECGIDVPGTTARYVTITSPMNTALHFADLRVYALPEEPKPAARSLASRIRSRARRFLAG